MDFKSSTDSFTSVIQRLDNNDAQFECHTVFKLTVDLSAGAIHIPPEEIDK